MNKVIPFPTHRKDRQTLEHVLQQMYEETGLDFFKLCTGDPEENRRLRKQFEREHGTGEEGE
ncbi:hypothetical protein KDJ56_22045 (plasmid) [Brevibacillus composti]|uniref:Uncharacterized protein n=1 Tax=Brevibacillus composti TaxID=2796470 RepID=A0A7T5JQX7_9BACL|nr:hypothetical protein [Brevibacillus composti]QQE76757.1 hypothetical protein JD108_22165 [Brevibacillus composti]QUO43823.1 hypothetical protein KDJ56_22045 [Brevibacillus composti]